MVFRIYLGQLWRGRGNGRRLIGWEHIRGGCGIQANDSHPWAILSHREALSVSGESWKAGIASGQSKVQGCCWTLQYITQTPTIKTSWWCRWWRVASSLWLVETSDAAKHCTMLRIAPPSSIIIQFKMSIELRNLGLWKWWWVCVLRN